MPEIEFRGKCVKTGIWVYGGFHKHQLITPSPIIPKGEKPPKVEYVCLIIESGFSDWELPKPIIGHAVTPKTVGQYTGLRDKSRHKAYEGDVLGKEGCWSYYVAYNDGGWVATPCDPVQRANNHSWPLTQDKLKEWVVIGNIHDNPAEGGRREQTNTF